VNVISEKKKDKEDMT